jgi:hypothetical protein
MRVNLQEHTVHLQQFAITAGTQQKCQQQVHLPNCMNIQKMSEPGTERTHNLH